MSAVLTQRPAVLHDQAGVQRGREGVCRGGEWPLIVTHWTHGATRVAVDSDLALRKAERTRHTTCFPVNITSFIGRQEFPTTGWSSTTGQVFILKTGVRGTNDLPHPVFSLPPFISHPLDYYGAWEVVRETRAASQWAHRSANRGAACVGHRQMNRQDTGLSRPGV